MAWRYLIALGSNMRHIRHGPPEGVLAAACAALEDGGVTILARAPVLRSAPIGPSRRRYANSAALIETCDDPEALLRRLKTLEHAFGRFRGGQRWGARVLDLDIVLWDGGAWSGPALTIPHPAFRGRAFVLEPAARLAPDWRDPLSGLTLRQLRARHNRRLTRPAAPLR